MSQPWLAVNEWWWRLIKTSQKSTQTCHSQVSYRLWQWISNSFTDVKVIKPVRHVLYIVCAVHAAAAVSKYYWVERKKERKWPWTKWAHRLLVAVSVFFFFRFVAEWQRAGGGGKVIPRLWLCQQATNPHTKLSWPEADCLQHSQVRHLNPICTFCALALRSGTHTHSCVSASIHACLSCTQMCRGTAANARILNDEGRGGHKQGHLCSAFSRDATPRSW